MTPILLLQALAGCKKPDDTGPGNDTDTDTGDTNIDTGDTGIDIDTDTDTGDVNTDPNLVSNPTVRGLTKKSDAYELCGANEGCEAVIDSIWSNGQSLFGTSNNSFGNVDISVSGDSAQLAEGDITNDGSYTTIYPGSVATAVSAEGMISSGHTDALSSLSSEGIALSTQMNSGGFFAGQSAMIQDFSGNMVLASEFGGTVYIDYAAEGNDMAATIALDATSAEGAAAAARISSMHSSISSEYPLADAAENDQFSVLPTALFRD